MKNSASINLHQTTSQRQQLSPQLQHAVKLLQMNTLELINKIDVELSENPFLELNDAISDEPESQQTINMDEPGNGNEEKDWEPIDLNINKETPAKDRMSETEEEFFEDSSDFGYAKKTNEPTDMNSKQMFIENAVSVSKSLYDHLYEQLGLTNASDSQFLIAEAIISSLDTDGYFKIPVKEFAASLKVTEEEVMSSLRLIQSFDPPGVCARDLRECLFIQLQNMPNPDMIVVQIVRDYFKLLEQRKHKELASRLGISLDELKNHLKEISNLEPIPARQFDTKKVKYIIPDIIVQKFDGKFYIMLNDDQLPSLRINEFYKKVMKTENMTDDVKTFLSEKYNDARLLISSLEKRRSTIYLVMEKILEMQIGFFNDGPQFLKPLTLKDVADEVNLHESTISRVTTSKYVDTPWGIYELKYFFSNSIQKTSGGVKSAQSVKELIKEIIENESGDKKLSDQKIVDILSNKGIKIARRTVAKYRKNLKIFSSYDRGQ